jgi:hypothetical protein
MARVCFVGDTDLNLGYELLSRETSREALSTYDIEEPFDNSLAVDTVSLGAAVSLCNDLNWYLRRFVTEAFVRDPSISSTEWLSRDLATAIRETDVRPEESDQLLKIYGLSDGTLVEPMYAARRGTEIPPYDLRDVDETVVVRVSETEFA